MSSNTQAYEIIDHVHDVLVIGAGGAGLRATLGMSDGGLKTACLKAIQKGENPEGIAKGMQEAVIEVLVSKTMRAVEEKDCQTLVLAGGVSANRGLRSAFAKNCQEVNVRLACPSIKLCTDNGAMVAKCGFDRYRRGYRSNLEVDVFSKLSLRHPPYRL